MESPPKGHTGGTTGQAAPERLGKFPLLSVIGTGSMGVVYKSLDLRNICDIALKTIRRELLDDDIENFSARFRIEAQAAGSLTHPGIVAVHEYGEVGGYAYIAMEYVDGNSLRECFERKTPFNIEQAVDILVQLLQALRYAHERGVWHRDVKPSNILITRDGHVKVTDFGIARVESLNLSHSSAVMGTPGFIAPEMYQGDDFDHRVDLFAAGVVLYQLLAGVPPFVGTPEKIMFKVCYETPLPASVVAREPALRPFDAVVLKALARKPEDRFANAAEFLDALLAAKDGGRRDANETVVVGRRQVPANETMVIPRQPTGGGPPAGSDETVIVPRRQPGGADQTVVIPRRRAGEAIGTEQAVVIPRRRAGDVPEADKTLVIPRETSGGMAVGDATVFMTRDEQVGAHAAGADKTAFMMRDEQVGAQAAVTDKMAFMTREGQASAQAVGTDKTAFNLRDAHAGAQAPRTDETVIVSHRGTGAPAAGAGADETIIVGRGRAGPPAGADETVIAGRRPDTVAPRIPQTQPIRPPRTLEPDGRTRDFRSPITSAPPLGWNPQELTRLEKELARFVGPIARVLVRSATRETSDQRSLIQWLASKIGNFADREAFLKVSGVSAASLTPPAHANSGAEASNAPTDGGSPLTPEYIARAVQLLAVQLGPIAAILAKRASHAGPSKERFVATLAAHLGDDGERQRFIRSLS